MIVSFFYKINNRHSLDIIQVPKGILKRVESPVPSKGILKDPQKIPFKFLNSEWNKGVRGSVQDSPRSPPGQVQEDLDTPMSPDMVEIDPDEPEISKKFEFSDSSRPPPK